MTCVNPNASRQRTPLLLVGAGLIACAFAEHFGFRDLVTIAVATNAAGLALLTQHHTRGANNDSVGTETTHEV